MARSQAASIPSNIGPKSVPWVDGEKINRAVTCLGNRTTSVSGPGGCGETGEPTCITNLVGRVAWGTSNKENLVFIGHSAGGIAGMASEGAVWVSSSIL